MQAFRPLESLGITPATHPQAFAVDFSRLEAVEGVDHWTFVVAPQNVGKFAESLLDRGFRFHGLWHAGDANHLSFIKSPKEGRLWTEMVGISVKTSETHPVLDLAEGLQHGAILVRNDVDFDAFCESLGIVWLTDTLEHRAADGSRLKQRFSEPEGGIFFWELIQRDLKYTEFDPNNINILYQRLAAHARASSSARSAAHR